MKCLFIYKENGNSSYLYIKIFLSEHNGTFQILEKWMYIYWKLYCFFTPPWLGSAKYFQSRFKLICTVLTLVQWAGFKISGYKTFRIIAFVLHYTYIICTLYVHCMFENVCVPFLDVELSTECTKSSLRML